MERVGNSLGVKDSTLYSYAVGVRFHYKDLLLGTVLNKSLDTSASSLDNSTDVFKKNCHGDYDYKLSKTAFERLVHEKEVRTGKNKKRMRTVLLENEWEDTVTTNLWNLYRIPHGFSFESSRLTRDAHNGKMEGMYQ